MENRPNDQVRTVEADLQHSTNAKQHKLLISTTRQARFLINTAFEPVAIHDLRNIVGSENIWMEKKQLLAQGWIIETTRRTMVDRDGKKVRAGFYQLDKEQQMTAIKSAREFLIGGVQS